MCSNLVAVFGGVNLDLRKAKFTKDTIIRAFCLFFIMVLLNMERKKLVFYVI